MVVKAKLKIVLKANDTVVAESEDPNLWQQILVAINDQKESSVSTMESKEESFVGTMVGKREVVEDDVIEFSREVGVDPKLAKAACALTKEPPFIHLDKHHYEALKSNTPPRGPKAVAPIVLAATLLILWKEKLGLDNTTSSSEVSSTLATIQLPLKNFKRAIDNCRWLQKRGNDIVINPARTTEAISVAKCYCLQESFD